MTTISRNHVYFGLSTFAVLLLSATLCLHSFAHVATAQDRDDIFLHVDSEQVAFDDRQSRLFESIRKRPYATQLRLVQIPNATALLHRPSVVLNVDANDRYRANLTRINERDTEQFTWIGQVQSQFGHVLLVVDDLDVTGRFQTMDAVYTINPLGAGLHVLARVDPSKLLQEEDDVVNEDGGGDATPDELNLEQEVGKTGDTFNMAIQGTSNIDALVVYTAAAASASGNINSVVDGAIDATNDALTNSGVPVTVSLAHKSQISYTEAQSHCLAADRLQHPSDGHMDNVHSLRDQYSADVVLLISNEDDASSYGCAFGIEVAASGAFATVEWDQAIGYYTFAHELGHLIGGRHHSDSNSQPRAYSHGYVYASANWRTVMATFSGSTQRIPYWASPDKTYGGVAMGTSNWNDVARVWDERASTVANFKTADPPPAAPTGLSVSGNIGDNPHLEWDASVGATTYKVYRCDSPSPGCTPNVYVGSTSSTSYDDTARIIGSGCGGGFDLFTMYHVVAGNAGGFSDPSYASGTCTETNKRGPIVATSLPDVVRLYGNYPNPFNPTTEIRFDLPQAMHTLLVIYDAMGREVERLVDGTLEPGVQRVTWDATDMPSGVYVYRLKADAFNRSQHMVLLK